MVTDEDFEEPRRGVLDPRIGAHLFVCFFSVDAARLRGHVTPAEAHGVGDALAHLLALWRIADRYVRPQHFPLGNTL